MSIVIIWLICFLSFGNSFPVKTSVIPTKTQEFTSEKISAYTPISQIVQETPVAELIGKFSIETLAEYVATTELSKYYNLTKEIDFFVSQDPSFYKNAKYRLAPLLGPRMVTIQNILEYRKSKLSYLNYANYKFKILKLSSYFHYARGLKLEEAIKDDKLFRDLFTILKIISPEINDQIESKTISYLRNEILPEYSWVFTHYQDQLSQGLKDKGIDESSLQTVASFMYYFNEVWEVVLNIEVPFENPKIHQKFSIL